jgi:N-acetyl-anhydromuramyl-L-alanine amidase AmpD/V8-like Glu-specific endopeptidase
MPAQIRPTRLDVTDRFPMVGFRIRSDGGPSQAEVAIATDPDLFTPDHKKDRTAANFYSTRGNGGVRFQGTEAGYTVPPEILARFIGNEKLYFGLATAGDGGPMKVAVRPNATSPYISIKGLSGRSMSRVRVLPNRQQRSAGYKRNVQEQLEWAGDAPAPGMSPVANGAAPDAIPTAAKPNGAAEPSHYDDGFGPLPDAQSETANKGVAQAHGLAAPSPEYPGASRFVQSPAHYDGRRGQSIDRIVIHITDAPSTSSTVNTFSQPGAKVSAHYLVAQDGEVIQFVSEADGAWHSGDFDFRSIGIEHVAVKQGGVSYPRGDGTMQHFDYMPPTDEQYSASAALVAYLCDKYDLTPDRTTIIGHNQAAPNNANRRGCPDSAWDWTHYMALVENQHVKPEVYQQPSEELSLRRSGSVAQSLAARGVGYPPVRALSDEPVSLTPPEIGTLGWAARKLAEAAIAMAPGGVGTLFNAVIALANSQGCSVGVGPQVGGGLGAGGALGYGIIFGKDGDLGVYGGAEIDIGFITSISATACVTIVQGGIDAFNGWNAGFAISGGEGIVGGAMILLNEKSEFVGASANVGVGVGFSPIDFYVAAQRGWSTRVQSLALAYAQGMAPPARARGRAPAQARRYSNGSGVGYSRTQGGGARALDAGSTTLDIRYRCFIPSPLIDSPLTVYGGDGRGFSENGGTSRGDLHARIILTPGGGIEGISIIDRHWGESTEYATSDSYHVEGKPDWWLGKVEGAQPTDRKTLAADDDNLNIVAGSPGSARNIEAMAENASIVSISAIGALPLSIVAPAIDADLAIMIRQTSSGGIECKVAGEHDGFPCHELYVNGVCVYSYDPVAVGSSPTALAPPMDVTARTDWIDCTGSGAMAQGLSRSGNDTLTRAQDYNIVKPYYEPTSPAEAVSQQLDMIKRIGSWSAGVPRTDFAPHSAICHLVFSNDDGTSAVGTGFYVSQDTIVTAAHLLYGKSSGQVFAGRNGPDSLANFPIAEADWSLHPLYDGTHDNDVAVIRVSTPPPNGFFFELDDLAACREEPIIVCGYAAEGGLDWTKQHLDADHVREVSNNLEIIFYNLQTTGGTSGSPVYYITAYEDEARQQSVQSIRVIGVHVDLATDRLNQGCRLSTAKIAWIQGRGLASLSQSLAVAQAMPNGGGGRPAGYPMALGDVETLPGLTFDRQAYPAAAPGQLNGEFSSSTEQTPEEMREIWRRRLITLVGNETADCLSSLPDFAARRKLTIAVSNGTGPGSALGSGLIITGEGVPYSFGVGRLDGAEINDSSQVRMAAPSDGKPIITIFFGADTTNVYGWTSQVPFTTSDPRVSGGAILLTDAALPSGVSFKLESAYGTPIEAIYDAVRIGWRHVPSLPAGSWKDPVEYPIGFAMATENPFGSPVDSAPTDADIALPPPPPPRARALDVLGTITAIGGILPEILSDSSGDISWELDQFKGLKHPNDKAPANPAPFTDAATIRLDDWPKLTGWYVDDIYAWFTVDWQHNGLSLGNVRIGNIGTNDAKLMKLKVRAQIMDDNILYEPGGLAALRVRFHYRFSRTPGDDIIAVTELQLFADGTYLRKSDWLQKSTI